MSDISENCIHVWEWNIPTQCLVCAKCGDNLNYCDITEHMNGLQSQLASTKARLAGYEWIPVSERLPDENVEVLILVDGAWGNYVHVGTYFSDLPQWNTTDGLYYHGHEYKRVTHWMPLPEGPKEDE